MKKVYAIPQAGCDYIVRGKKYEVLSERGEYFSIITEYGSRIHFAAWRNCDHIKGNWDRVEKDVGLPRSLMSKVPFTQKRKIPLP